MAEVRITANDVLYWSRELAHRYEAEIAQAAAPLPEPAQGPIECHILVEGYVDRPAPKYADLQFSLPGWVTRFSVPFNAGPGEIRQMVARVFRFRGLVK